MNQALNAAAVAPPKRAVTVVDTYADIEAPIWWLPEKS